jgi:hypothetical protein
LTTPPVLADILPMTTILRRVARVLPGNRIELSVPDLKVGERVEVS